MVKMPRAVPMGKAMHWMQATMKMKVGLVRLERNFPLMKLAMAMEMEMSPPMPPMMPHIQDIISSILRSCGVGPVRPEPGGRGHGDSYEEKGHEDVEGGEAGPEGVEA